MQLEHAALMWLRLLFKTYYNLEEELVGKDIFSASDLEKEFLPFFI